MTQQTDLTEVLVDLRKTLTGPLINAEAKTKINEVIEAEHACGSGLLASALGYLLNMDARHRKAIAKIDAMLAAREAKP